MQQALDYADILNIPFVFSSNGNAFLFHDRTSATTKETTLALDAFPPPFRSSGGCGRRAATGR